MALLSFDIQNVKAITRAECPSIPKVMVIAGPNGVGKSTLLYEISQKRGTTFEEGTTTVLYQPPHRALRKTTVQRKFLMGDNLMSFSEMLGRTDVGGLEGLQISYPARTPDNVDEAGSTIKYTLGKIENRRLTFYAGLVDKSQKQGLTSVDISALPDIYEPLRELTKYLLPHLEFDRVDFSSENNIRCIWHRTDRQNQLELDIDDLSSGEKSIIILFLPLLENEINAYLKAIERINDPAQLAEIENLPGIPDRLFIVDEPELHLHPDLQTKILTYFRTLSTGSNVQFIISTHSPTLLDQALDDELYLFRAPSDEGTENQLKKVASNIEKLEGLKQLAGNTYLVTTGRSIICIEGETNPATNPADIRLFQLLYPRANAFTFVPTGGKANVIKTVQQLREHLPEDNFGIKIFGITDLDQTPTTVDGIYTLPVAMIENLLLDEGSLFEYAQNLAIEEIKTVADVQNSLNDIIQATRDEEVEFRVMRALKGVTVRIKGKSLDEVKENLAQALKDVSAIVPDDKKLKVLINQAIAEVDELVKNGNALKSFRGKTVLQKFYQKHILKLNISYSRFCYELAEIIAKNGKCDVILNALFDQLLV